MSVSAVTDPLGSSASDPGAGEAPCDLVAGLATYNHARTAPAVARVVQLALQSDSFRRWQIVIADGGSVDGTRERVREALSADGLVELSYAPRPGEELSLPYHGLPGRARAVKAILQHAGDVRARVCVVVDAASTNLEPATVSQLAHPVAAGEVDLLTARHARHPFTGALVPGVVYPMFRALYGARCRDPLAIDFSCSIALIDALQADRGWDDDTGHRAVDLWRNVTAVSNGLRIGEALLGPKQREDRGPIDAGTAVSQVMSALFAEVERSVDIWHRVRGSRPVREFSVPVDADPPEPEVDVRQLVESFRLGYRELEAVWAQIMPPLALLQWKRLAGAPGDAFRVDDVLWARTIYDFAMGHRLSVIARDHLLGSLTPLYLGWLASFVLECRHLSVEQIDARVERLCAAFEAEKPYLISLWRWPERFRPVRVRR